MRTRTVAILGYEGVQALDVAGPADAFTIANQVVNRKPDPYRVVLLCAGRGRIESESGLSFYCDASLARSGLLDTILVPGGRTLRTSSAVRTSMAKWLREHANRARRVASVCTGIYALAESGLLDGRRATTHWRYAADVREHWDRITITADEIYVKDGKFYSSAGITAGIDLCLWFIEEDFGRDVAMQVAREMVVYLRRSGGQMQYSQPLAMQVQAKGSFADIGHWIHGNLTEELTVERIAERANLSPRHFTRRFRSTFGISPAEFVEEMRLDEARWLLVNAADAIADVAANVGYANDETFRRAFARRFGIAPLDYRHRFGGDAAS